MNSPSHYAVLFGAVCLLSFNGLFSNGIPLDAGSMTVIRSLFAAITLAIFIALTRGNFRLNTFKQFIIVYGLGLVMGIHWLTYFYSMQATSVAIGMLALFTYPVITVLIEPWFSKKKLHILDVALAVLVLIGLGVMTSGNLQDSSLRSDNIIIGIAAGVISAITFSMRNVLQKYYCHHIASDTLMLHQLIIIGLMSSVFLDIPASLALEHQDWFYLIVLGVFTTAIAHTLLVKSYKLFSAKTVAMLSCLHPVLGAIAAWLVLKETLSLATIIGGAIILSVAVYESLRAKNQ